MEETDITGYVLPDDAQLTPAGSEPASGNPAPETMTLDELNALTGKKFPSKESALKSIKDTFVAVVKREPPEVRSDPRIEEVTKEIQTLRTEMFYKDNPEYTEYRGIITKLGGNPAEVVQSEEFKKVFEKAKGFDTIQNSRTVLDSNPRLAATKDVFAKAKEAQQQGRLDESNNLIARGVLDAFNIK